MEIEYNGISFVIESRYCMVCFNTNMIPLQLQKPNSVRVRVRRWFSFLGVSPFSEITIEVGISLSLT